MRKKLKIKRPFAEPQREVARKQKIERKKKLERVLYRGSPEIKKRMMEKRDPGLKKRKFECFGLPARIPMGKKSSAVQKNDRPLAVNDDFWIDHGFARGPRERQKKSDSDSESPSADDSVGPADPDRNFEIDYLRKLERLATRRAKKNLPQSKKTEMPPIDLDSLSSIEFTQLQQKFHSFKLDLDTDFNSINNQPGFSTNPNSAVPHKFTIKPLRNFHFIEDQLSLLHTNAYHRSNPDNSIPKNLHNLQQPPNPDPPDINLIKS